MKGEIRITKEQFDKAMIEVSEEMVKDDNIGGMAKLLISMTGMAFAKKLEEKLFDNNVVTNEESTNLMDTPVSTDCADEEKI